MSNLTARSQSYYCNLRSLTDLKKKEKIALSHNYAKIHNLMFNLDQSLYADILYYGNEMEIDHIISVVNSLDEISFMEQSLYRIFRGNRRIGIKEFLSGSLEPIIVDGTASGKLRLNKAAFRGYHQIQVLRSHLNSLDKQLALISSDFMINPSLFSGFGSMVSASSFSNFVISKYYQNEYSVAHLNDRLLFNSASWLPLFYDRDYSMKINSMTFSNGIMTNNIGTYHIENSFLMTSVDFQYFIHSNLHNYKITTWDIIIQRFHGGEGISTHFGRYLSNIFRLLGYGMIFGETWDEVILSRLL